MSLSEFIRKNEQTILKDWEDFAQSHIDAAREMNRAELRDHLISILKFITDDLNSKQTEYAQKEKSKGSGPKAGGIKDSAAETHANLRFMEGFNAIDLMAEFRALRASVIRLWERERSYTPTDYHELIRFNEAIDQISMEGLIRYNEKVNHARNLFLASLVHDLRNPLGTVSLAAQMLSKMPNLDERQKILSEQIFTSTSRTVRLVSDLIDDVRARLGKGMPINVHPMNIESAIDLAVAEIKISYPEQKISVWAEGDLDGEWDGTRIGQLLSNLIGNAAQHGQSNKTIEITAKGKKKEVILTVHNYGTPIPPHTLPHIFKALSQASNGADVHKASDSLGLGLFISREIIIAHGGTIDVTSAEDTGTTFIIHLPRSNTCLSNPERDLDPELK